MARASRATRKAAGPSSTILSLTTTNATGTDFPSGGGLLTIPTDTTTGFSVHIVARRTDADDESALYQMQGCIDNNAGTVALVGSVTKTVVAEDTAAWDVSAIADNSNKALTLRVTGEASKTIAWQAHVRLFEITG